VYAKTKYQDNEGWPGDIISQVHDEFAQSKGMLPNLVLLNVGTNDCLQDADPSNAGERLQALIDDIYASIPGVTVIMSTVLPNTQYEACMLSVSSQYRDRKSHLALFALFKLRG
jgi:lysophospholipase L1-like esterase